MRWLALLPLVALVACLQPPAEGDEGPELAVVFGDSLATMSRPEKQNLYIEDPLWRASFNVTGGTQLDTPAWVEGYPQVGDLAQGGQPLSTVILALGTNDIGCTVDPAPECGPADTLGSVKQDLRDAVVAASQAGAVRVVIPNVNTYSASIFHGGIRLPVTEEWNAWLLQAEASVHPDWAPLDVVDWDVVANTHPEWIGPDQIHHTVEGQTAYARFLYEARLP